MESRLLQYQKILKREQKLFEASEQLYQCYREPKDVVSITAIYVMAPVMYQFVDWVLNNAIAAGHKRLYFLARDGYSMYHMAKILCEKRKLPIDCRYLYCSRYALRTAQYHLLGEESLDYICLGGIEVTIWKVMRRSGLMQEECQMMLQRMGRVNRSKEVLSYSELADIKKMLALDEEFMDLVYKRSKERYSLVCGYLEQEGLLEPLTVALVDSGWTGSIQKSVRQLIASRGIKAEVEGYYFGLYEYPPDVEIDTYHTFYFNPVMGLRHKVYFSNSLFECIYSSPEGMTVGYVLHDKQYYPILEKEKNPNSDKIEKTTDILCRYAYLLADSGSSYDCFCNCVDKIDYTVYRLLYYFMGRPGLEEAAAFGSYIFCDDVIDEHQQTVAANLSFREIRNNWLLNKSICYLKKEQIVRESAWMEGSVVLARRNGWFWLWHSALYKYVLYLRKRVTREKVS